MPVARVGRWRLVRHWLQAVQVLSLWLQWLMLRLLMRRLMLQRLVLPPHPMQRPRWLLLAALRLFAWHWRRWQCVLAASSQARRALWGRR